MRWIVAGGADPVATTDVSFLALPAEAPIWPCGRSPACSHPIAVPDVPATPACDAARWRRCAGGRRWLPIAGPPEKSAVEADEPPLRRMLGSTGRVRGVQCVTARSPVLPIACWALPGHAAALIPPEAARAVFDEARAVCTRDDSQLLGRFPVCADHAGGPGQPRARGQRRRCRIAGGARRRARRPAVRRADDGQHRIRTGPVRAGAAHVAAAGGSGLQCAAADVLRSVHRPATSRGGRESTRRDERDRRGGSPAGSVPEGASAAAGVSRPGFPAGGSPAHAGLRRPAR